MQPIKLLGMGGISLKKNLLCHAAIPSSERFCIAMISFVPTQTYLQKVQVLEFSYECLTLSFPGTTPRFNSKDREVEPLLSQLW